MGLDREYKRYSKKVTRSKRWKSLRLLALRRDGFRCVKCGAKGRLEVDHIAPVRDAPDLSYELGNLQSLCTPCHTRKTRLECGHDPMHPERQKWRDSLKELGKSSPNVL